MISIPFFQSTWNGIDLMKICQEIGESNNNLPSANFYKCYYDKLLNDSKLSTSWQSQKQLMTKWLTKQILKYGTKKSVCLSIGAGTGIVELPLINDGFHIDLHDFQNKSFEIFSVATLTNCYSCNLEELGHNKYDIIFSIATTYAIDKKKLFEYLTIIKQLLKPNGVFLWLDTSLSWKEIYSYFRNKDHYKRNCVMWGYKRDLHFWQNCGKQFSCLEKQYYDQDMNQLYMKQFLGIPLMQMPVWQYMVLKKND